MRVLPLLLVSALVATGTPWGAVAQERPVPCGGCVVAELSVQQAMSLGRSGDPLDGLTVLIAAGTADRRDVAAAVSALASLRARPGLVLPVTETGLGAPMLAAADTILIDLASQQLDAALGFEAKSRAAALRGLGARRIGLRLAPGQKEEAARQGLWPYFDVLVMPGHGATGPEDPFSSTERWTTWPAEKRIDAVHLLTLPALDGANGILVSPGPGDEALLPLLAALARAVPAGLSALPEVSVKCDKPCRAHGYLDARTLDAIVVVHPVDRVSSLVVQPAATGIIAILPSLGRLVAQPAGPPAWLREASGAEMSVPDVAESFVLRVRGWQGSAAPGFATGVEVSADRTLRAEEIIARHQAASAARAGAVRTLVSSGSTVLAFDAPGFSAPVTVTADTVLYAGPQGTEVEQREIRVNGLKLATRGDEVPKLPLIEAERVSVPPLAIALNEAYRYRLEGRETLRGRPAYVVAFEPRESDRSLFKGRAWIDEETFGLLRLDATQTGLPGPVVTSRQVDDFDLERLGEVAVWLPSRSEINQRYETAGYATPIRRVVTLTKHTVNPSDFTERLAAAHESDAVMMRDTPEGYRYLRRRPGGAGPVPDEKAAEASSVREIVDDRADRIRTLAGGVTWDPNITTPLVFAGLSYLDFNLFGTGAQVDAFFGGTYGRLAWSGPAIGRSGWRPTGDAFGIAVSYNDRVFRGGVEQYRENVTQRPFHAAAGFAGPLPLAWRLRISYEMDYVRYRRANSTAPEFLVPESTPVHGVRLLLERQRGAWVLGGWWNRGVRQHWGRWGLPARDEPVIRSFDRAGLRAARSFVWSPRAVGRVEVVWMDGRRLDRFSRYSFGTFDNPLRGYPSASIGYDRGLVLRSTASWTATPRLRLDGFADLGIVAGEQSNRARGYPGVGAAVEFPAPFGMLTAVEWGYGISGHNQHGGRGTHVFRVSAYKVF